MTPNELTPDLAAFIEAQTSIFLATASANGQPHIQHRGPPKFLRVLDDETPGNGSPCSCYPPVAGGAAGNPDIPGPNLRAATPSHHATRHHKKMYMSTNRTHKGSKTTPGY